MIKRHIVILELIILFFFFIVRVLLLFLMDFIQGDGQKGRVEIFLLEVAQTSVRPGGAARSKYVEWSDWAKQK